MKRVEIGEREEEQKTRPSGRSGVLDGCFRGKFG